MVKGGQCVWVPSRQCHFLVRTPSLVATWWPEFPVIREHLRILVAWSFLLGIMGILVVTSQSPGRPHAVSGALIPVPRRKESTKAIITEVLGWALLSSGSLGLRLGTGILGFFFLFVCFAFLRFELRASRLLGRRSTT
jgi:hypothetical protein